MESRTVFKRVEKKYRLDSGQWKSFLQAVQGKIHPDQYGRHTIHNIYYDTEEYQLVRSSIEKPQYKEKFRVRGYGEMTADSPVFFEIKKKHAGIVYKRRVELTRHDAREFLASQKSSGSQGQIMKEIAYFFSFYRPVPKLYLAYDRIAYVGDEDAGLRITVDENIRGRWEQLDFSHGSDGTMLDDGHLIMEIKVASAYPIWLARLLSELAIYPVSFSKYGSIYKQAARAGKIQTGKGEKQCLQVY